MGSGDGEAAGGGIVTRYHARIIEEMADFQRDRIRLAIADELPDGTRRLLFSNGLWSEPVKPWEIVPTAHGVEVGITLPVATLEPIVQAIEEFRGAATHGPTAEKILRESLEVERRRVDAALERRPEWILLDGNGIRKMGGGA